MSTWCPNYKWKLVPGEEIPCPHGERLVRMNATVGPSQVYRKEATDEYVLHVPPPRRSDNWWDGQWFKAIWEPMN